MNPNKKTFKLLLNPYNSVKTSPTIKDIGNNIVEDGNWNPNSSKVREATTFEIKIHEINIIDK